MPLTFDECFQTFPPLKIPSDYKDYWVRSIKELKSFPIKKQSRAQLKGTILKETIYEISYQGYNNYTIHGTLVIPRKRGKLPVVAYFHDYAENTPEIQRGLTEIGVAQLLIDLRGHGHQLIRPELKEGEEADPDWTPGYFASHADDKEAFYMRFLYLDALRAIDFLRLADGIDGDKIILHGKGLGAAMASFGAAFSNRIKGIILEAPNFCSITEEQLKLNKSWMKELNDSVSRSKTKKTNLKKNLEYFDGLNFSEKIKCPALVSVGMEDRISHPRSVFGFFNHLSCEKEMQVYPTDGHDAGKEKQKAANINFIQEIISLSK